MEYLWLVFVIVGQFLNAIVVLFDKRILSKTVSKPIVYTFYVSLLSGVALIMLPFEIVSFPSTMTLALSLLTGFSYTLSLLFLYKALHLSRPSEVTPVVGALSAIATFVFSFWILGDLLPQDFLLGFILLVLGMLLISHFQITKKAIFFTVLAGICFGLSSVLLKWIFNIDTFANGFFWSRMANVVGALLLLLWPNNLRTILKDFRHAPAKGKFLILNNKILAGLAFLCILIAINLGHVTLVNALSSLQYIFLLIFAIIFSHSIKNYFFEKDHKGEVAHKIAAIGLIVLGFIVLFT